jgi:hemerythrin-like domain-containing protein
MTYRLVSDQMLKEHEVLARISDALRTAIRWGQHADLSRKLAAVAFLTEAFQRHLNHMLELEERGGYLELLNQSLPQFHDQANVFRDEHEQFRATTQRLLQRMTECAEPTQSDADAIFSDLTSLLEAADDHNQRELTLLQQIILEHAGEADPRD